MSWTRAFAGVTAKSATLLICLGLLALVPGHSAAAAPAQRIEQKAAITTTGGGPYFRLNLPVTIYATAAYSDLRDVRVRNGAGSLVPHAWLNGTDTEAQVDSASVPFFAVPARGKAQEDLTLVFKRTTDGSLKLAAPAKKEPERTVTEWIADAGHVRGRLLQLRLTLDARAEGLFPLHIDASDDLRRWRTLVADAQIAVLQRGADRIEKLDVELPETEARFLRLRWRDETLAPALTAVTLDTVQRHETAPPLQWSDAVPPICGEKHCDYEVPAKMPLDSLRVQLAEPNTLARITISGFIPASVIRDAPHRHNPLYVLRHKRQVDAARAEPGEAVIATSVVYRLAQAGGEARSPDIALDGRVYERLRIRIEEPIARLGNPPPVITVAAAPRSLVFLGQGGPPFTLHWGVDEPHGKAAPLSLIAPKYRPGQNDFAELARVDIPAPPPREEKPLVQATPKDKDPAPSSDRRLWLWAALAGGLLVLAAMAWSLFRGMDARR